MHLDLRNFHLFTHAGCMDGSASAILFQHAGGDFKNIHWVRAGGVDEYLVDCAVIKDPNKQLLFVDIAPSSNETAMFLQSRGNAFVIDHHASAVQFAGRPGFIIDVKNAACGCENFRQWLVRGGMIEFNSAAWQRFTHVIDDHDRWQLKIPFSLELPRFFSFIGQQEFTSRFMNVPERFAVEKDDYWNSFESDMMTILRKEQARRFHSVLKRFVVTDRDVKGAKKKFAYVISGEINCSELLNQYLTLHPDVDVAVQMNPDLNKVSLRSNDKVDIVEFVAPWGGGGHKNAGGQQLPDDLTRKVADLVHGEDVRR
jgi:oligoribonuclease NrnB/cAMP/cGMP phosphodiesterase (DHH superfamily)